MVRTASLTTFLLVFFWTFQMFNSQNLKIKRSSAEVSTRSQDEMQETTTTEDVCGPPPTESPNGQRMKRSELRSFNDSASNETTHVPTTEEVVDYSHLSEEFKSCLYLALEPECYEKRSDGTVFVPVYDRSFPKSDFLIRGDTLYICSQSAEVSTHAQDEMQETTTTEDVCGPPPTESPNGQRMKRSELRLFNDSASNETSHEPTTEEVVDYSHLSNKFKSCLHLALEPECYEKQSDGTVFVPVYGRSFPKSDFLIRDDTLYICPDFFSETKFPGHLEIISLVGSGISVACLLLHIVVYVAIKTAKNLPSRCLLSLCVALLLAYFFTFVQHAANDDESCRVVGMFMVYFFLAAFFWMNVFSYDVWRSVRLATTKLRLAADRPMMVRFARYSVYAWGSPLLISIVSIIVHNSTSNKKFQLIFDINICWFAHKQALALYFVGPLFTLLGINILLTVSSFCMIFTAKMKGNSGKDNFDLWVRLCLSLKLGSSMGLMWVFGVIAVVTRQEWLWYLFAVCSALQGLFIFLSFTVSERNRKECRKALNSRKSSATPTQTSSNHVHSV